MSLDQSHISRRTIAKGAAWTVPAVAVAAAAPSLAASNHACPNQVVSTTVTYHVTAHLFSNAMDQGIWTAVVEATMPTCVHACEPIAPPTMKVTVTTSDAAANTMRGLGITSLEGTSAAKYSLNVGGTVMEFTGDLVIPRTNVPSEGPITTIASGSGQASTAPCAPGATATASVGTFTASLQAYKGEVPDLVIPLTSEFDPADQDKTLGTIEIVA